MEAVVYVNRVTNKPEFVQELSLIDNVENKIRQYNNEQNPHIAVLLDLDKRPDIKELYLISKHDNR